MIIKKDLEFHLGPNVVLTFWVAKRDIGLILFWNFSKCYLERFKPDLYCLSLESMPCLYYVTLILTLLLQVCANDELSIELTTETTCSNCGTTVREGFMLLCTYSFFSLLFFSAFDFRNEICLMNFQMKSMLCQDMDCVYSVYSVLCRLKCCWTNCKGCLLW